MCNVSEMNVLLSPSDDVYTVHTQTWNCKNVLVCAAVVYKNLPKIRL